MCGGRAPGAQAVNGEDVCRGAGVWLGTSLAVDWPVALCTVVTFVFRLPVNLTFNCHTKLQRWAHLGCPTPHPAFEQTPNICPGLYQGSLPVSSMGWPCNLLEAALYGEGQWESRPGHVCRVPWASSVSARVSNAELLFLNLENKWWIANLLTPLSD